MSNTCPGCARSTASAGAGYWRLSGPAPLPSASPLPSRAPGSTSCCEALGRRAAEHGVRLGFLSEYAAVPDPAHAHTLVVNYAGLDAEKLPEAMALLSEVFA